MLDHYIDHGGKFPDSKYMTEENLPQDCFDLQEVGLCDHQAHNTNEVLAESR